MPDILAQKCHGLIEFLLELCVLRQRSLPRLHGLLILLHGRVGRRGRRLCPLPRKRHDVAGGCARLPHALWREPQWWLRRHRQQRRHLHEPRIAGHRRERAVVEVLGDEPSEQADHVASEPRYGFLMIAQPQRRELRLDLLRRRRLRWARRTADDVGDPGDLVDDLFRLVARLVELHQHGGDLLNRQPVDDLIEAALVGREGHPILDRHEHVLLVVIEDRRERGLLRAGIDAHYLERALKLVDAAGQRVELDRLILVLDVIGHRNALIRRRRGEQRVGRGEELRQTERIILFVEDEPLRRRREPDGALLDAVPYFPNLGLFQDIRDGIALVLVGALRGEVELDLIGLAAAEALAQLVAGEERAIAQPCHFGPGAGRRLAIVLPEHVLNAGALVYDFAEGIVLAGDRPLGDITFLGCAAASSLRVAWLRALTLRSSSRVSFRINLLLGELVAVGRLLDHPHHPPAGDQPIDHPRAHRLIEAPARDRHLERRLHYSAADPAVPRVRILELTLDIGLWLPSVKRRQQRLHVAPQDVELVLVPRGLTAIVAVALDDHLGALDPLFLGVLGDLVLG